MTRLQEKARGHTKQIVGRMIQDDQLVYEGKQQVREAQEQADRHSDQGSIVKDEKASEQPKDKERAQTVHKTGAKNSASKEASRDPRLSDAEKKD